jgi:hypothetical protein
MCVLNISLAQINLNHGLIGCYKFDGNAFDESTSLNHGTIVGAVPTANRFGEANKAYFFDGINDYISLSPALLKSSSYSYVVWAKVSSNPGFDQARNVISIGDAYDSKHQTINVSSVYASTGLTGWNVGGYNDGVPTTTSLQSYRMPDVDQWYHLAITRDNKTMKMYLDGVLIAEGSTNGNEPYYGANTNAHIGIRCNFTQPFHGSIDDLAIYNRVLSDIEVRAVYLSGLACDGEVGVEDVERCGPGEVTIHAWGADEYLWLDKIGNELFSGTPLVVDLTESKTFYLRARRGGTTVPDIRVNAVIKDLPEFELRMPESAKVDEKLTFVAEMEPGQTALFSWQIDGVDLATTGPLVEQFLFTAKEVTVAVSAESPNGCTYHREATLEVAERYPESDLFAGLLGCYSLDGDADDRSGNANHGAVHNAVPAKDRFDCENKAFYFDGNSYISLPPEPFKNNSYTFAVWAKAHSNPGPGGAAAVFSIGDLNDSKHQTINVNNVYASNGLVGWNCGGYNDGFPTTTSLQSYRMPNVGQWYHVAMTRTNEVMKMYINGELVSVGYTNGNSPYYGNVTKAHLGIRCNFSQPFHGVIDDFVIYDRDLSGTEIQKLYENGLPCQDIEVVYETDCGQEQFTITASGADQYYWYNGNGDLIYKGNPLKVNLTTSSMFAVEGIQGNKRLPKVEIEVVVMPLPEISCDFPELELFMPTQLEAQVSGNGPFTYTWTVNSQEYQAGTSPYIEITPLNLDETTVNLSVTDVNGCVVECLTSLETKSYFFIPNVITVNGDGKNEMFNLYRKFEEHYLTYQGPESFAMEIFNRWGRIIYESNEPSHGWNGSEQTDGIYFYQIRVGNLTFRGWVHLIKS